MRVDAAFQSSLFIAAASAVFVIPVAAQTPPTVPTREEIQRGEVERPLQDQTQPITIDTQVERSACPLASPEFADVRFTVNSVRFDGLVGADASDLNASYAEYLGRDVPVAVVCDIRDRAATILRDAGYLAAVQIPPQEIQDGNVTLDVLMARLSAIEVVGDAGPSQQLLERYLAELTSHQVFNIDEAERYLLLAGDIPGLAVRLSLRPVAADAGGVPGDVIGQVSVIRTPVYADFNVQNLGSRAVGRFGGSARVRLNGITGLGDETTLNVFSTGDLQEQQVVQASHEFRVGGEGLTFGINGTYAWAEPDLPGGLRLNSETLVAEGFASFPFVRTQARNVFGTVGLEYIDQRTDLLGVRTNEDRLSVVYARMDFGQIDQGSISGGGGYSAYEPKWGINGSIELRHGLDMFGASEGCGPAFIRCVGQSVVPTRADGDPTAFVGRVRASIDYRPTPLLAFSLSSRAQYSPEALFSYEEFSGGNYTVGRGYDPGTIVGDSGVGLQLEASYGSLIPARSDGLAVQPYVFVDGVAVWNRNIPDDPQKLYSAGGGIRATIGSQAWLDIVAAVPLKRPQFQSSRGDARALMTLTIQLAPWRR